MEQGAEVGHKQAGDNTLDSGYETLNIQASDVFTAAEYDIKQVAVAITMSGLEMIQNSGKEQVIDLLESRIRNAERTMMNNLAADVYSTGAADGGKQIGGLQALIADNPASGIVGGINRANWTFWRNSVFDATDEASATTSGTIQNNMTIALLKVTRGTDRPKIIIADNKYFATFAASLQAIQRIQRSDSGDAGFQEVMFNGIPVIADGGYGGNAPTTTGTGLASSRMYFINTDFLYLRPFPERDMKPIGDDRFSVNQDAMVKLIGWAGNLTMSNAFLQLVYKE